MPNVFQKMDYKESIHFSSYDNMTYEWLSGAKLWKIIKKAEKRFIESLDRVVSQLNEAFNVAKRLQLTFDWFVLQEEFYSYTAFTFYLLHFFKHVILIRIKCNKEHITFRIFLCSDAVYIK